MEKRGLMMNDPFTGFVSQGFSEESLKAAWSLLYEETPKGECRPKPKPRSPEQRQATQQAQQVAQQQNQTFDSMPQQQVQEAASKGGQSERKKTLPICPDSV